MKAQRILDLENKAFFIEISTSIFTIRRLGITESIKIT